MKNSTSKSFFPFDKMPNKAASITIKKPPSNIEMTLLKSSIIAKRMISGSASESIKNSAASNCDTNKRVTGLNEVNVK